tara:strand:- start:15110 stop:15793 length:684 start_codon:yes stop_codon:yes gene_type:complete
MGRSVWFKALGVFFALFLLTPSVSAHEQETLNVILVSDEIRPGNVTDTAFVEGNGIVFRMRDSTENASMQIRIDLNQDGVFGGDGDSMSVWLTRSCTLDENGTLEDESCAVSHALVFGNASAGTYAYQVERVVNNSTTDVWNHSVIVHQDIHEEPGQPSIGDCFGAGCDEAVSDDEQVKQSLITTENTLYAVMVFAALGIFMLAISIRNDRANRDGPESIELTQESE